jgi:SAM-dependent methyltransferase
MGTSVTDEQIKQEVRKRYGQWAGRFGEPMAQPANTAYAAQQGTIIPLADSVPSNACCAPGDRPVGEGCCSGESGQGRIADLLYSSHELAVLPESVTGAAAGCGNPTAIAELRPGETVLDLGSGGGIDCFLAARQVGPHGQVIGLDMTPEMVKLARRNAKKLALSNVDFRWGEIEEIPLPDDSVDVVISNCVINLSPDKDAVFAETYRVLRPGGRLAVSDMVLEGDLPPTIRARMDSWAACISGALEKQTYLDKIREAGFADIEVASVDYVPLCVPDWESGTDKTSDSGIDQRSLARMVASIKVKARKPA